METQYTSSSSLLRLFRKIEPGAHFRIIHFFTLYSAEIAALDKEEYLIILSYYVDALFEVGGQEAEVLKRTQELLELSIIENIQYVDGADIYMRALLQRAISCMQIGRKEEGLKLATQLYRLAPKNKSYQRLMRDCLLVCKPKWIMHSFKASIGFMISAFFIKIIGFAFALGSIENLIMMGVFICSSLCSLACLYGQYKYVQKPMRNLLIRKL